MTDSDRVQGEIQSSFVIWSGILACAIADTACVATTVLACAFAHRTIIIGHGDYESYESSMVCTLVPRMR